MYSLTINDNNQDLYVEKMMIFRIVVRIVINVFLFVNTPLREIPK